MREGMISGASTESVTVLANRQGNSGEVVYSRDSRGMTQSEQGTCLNCITHCLLVLRRLSKGTCLAG